MRSTLDRLTAEASDSELIAAIAAAIEASCARLDADARRHHIGDLPLAPRTVGLVTYAHGILGNGGFQYFFEGDTALFADEIAASFDAIGVPRLAESIRAILGLFPRRGRYVTVEEAEEQFARVARRHARTVSRREDMVFADLALADGKLAAYIRARPDEFRAIERWIDWPTPRDLIARLKNGTGRERCEAAYAIKRRQVRRAVPALARALADKDRGVRQMAAEAIRALGGSPRAAIPALIAALDDRDPMVRSHACDGLKLYGRKAAAAADRLRQLSRSRDEMVRSSAVDALDAVTGR